MELRRYTDQWSEDDRHANFKSEVACYTAADPMPTLHNLSRGTGIPVECLARYVLVKYAASGSDALLGMDPIVFRQMRRQVETEETEGTADGGVGAYEALKEVGRVLGRGEVRLA